MSVIPNCTVTRESMRRDIADLLDVAPQTVGDDDDLLRLGLDSIGAMRLASRWHRAGAAVSFADLIEWRTLGDWWRLACAAAVPVAEVAAELPPEGAPFALSTMQQAYWVGRADGRPLGGVGSHFYNEFEGAGVDPARLERAVAELVRRHGMLRVRFLDDGRQQIMPDGAWTGLSVLDLRAATAVEANVRLHALREELSATRLRVADGEVFDIRLTQLPGGRSRIHVHIEMLVADAHSFRVLLADLAALYLRPDQPLPPLAIDFPGYLARSAPARRAARERAADYWRSRLDTLPGAPDLPLAARPEDTHGHRMTRRHHWVDADRWALLRDRSRAHGLTLTMVFLTAYAEVLGAWSGQPRFLLNLPVYDREMIEPDVDRLVGDFTGLALLEADTSGDAGFTARVRALQDRLRADLAHVAYSGLDVLRDLSRAAGLPVYAPVVFTGALSLGELFDPDVRRCFGDPVWTMSQTPQVWLDFQVTERESGLYLNWDAVDGLLAPGVLDAMFAAYLRVLDWLAADDVDWAGRAPVRPDAAQLAVRAAVNNTDGPLDRRTLHAPFFARAAAEPDRLALAWGEDGRWSYGELAGAALRHAAALRAKGLTSGEPVAVTLPRGPEQIAAVLGVLAAGGAYVPIGVDQPAARRDRIHAAAGIRFSVTGAASCEPVPAPAAADLAYVIFTSGSTGQPKGVAVGHLAAVNTIDAINDRWAIREDDRVLAVSALDFDLSVYDIFGPLSVGGAVILVGEGERRDAGRWRELIRRHRVTIWQSVPMLLDVLLTDAEGAGERLGLRLALLGGDRIGTDLPGRFVARCPGGRFVGLGGTTEAAIHSTALEVTSVADDWSCVPYGTPLRNVRCAVVDDAGRDRPDWVPGELWIGGVSLADGYLGDPDRTADRFVVRDGIRWYRTGDVARYRPGGLVEFLGRADHQLKVRGHRIEPGEVEAALLACPGVVAAVVLPYEGRLGAAVVAEPEADLSPQRLSVLLGERLPAYMVPWRTVVLDAIPLSPNGKIDRRAIGAALTCVALPETGDTRPRGAVEEAVAAIWAELLGAGPAARTDDFFAAGGDSLQATRLMSRLRAAGLIGGRLELLLAKPRLADFAATLRLGAAWPQGRVTADPDRRHEPFPPTEVQRAYWLGRSADLALGGVGSHWYWEFEGSGVDLERLEDALNRLVDRHDMLRVVFDAEGRQRVLADVPRLRIAEAAPGELRATVAHRVPDPTRWPPLHVWAAPGDEGRVRLGFSFDYIALDALSIVIVLSELSALYRDPAAQLPPVGVSFRDYVLTAGPGAEEIEAAERHWWPRLDDLPGAPELPLRVSPGEVTAARFARREARLDPVEWRGITARAATLGLTPAAVMLAAYAEVLAGFSTDDRFSLNLTLFDRRDAHPDIDRVVGDFTSLLLVANEPVPGETFVDAARRLQARMWADIEHRAVSALRIAREQTRRTGRSTSGIPVVFTSALGVASSLTDLTFPFGELVWGLSQTPQVWLDCQVMERGGGVTVNWDAAEELFHPGVLDAMFDRYLALLRRLSADDWLTGPASMLTEAQRSERHRVNATVAPVREDTLHGPFFAAAAGAPAIVQDETLTHADLARRALAVAGALSRDGVMPGDAVAVTVPKGPSQIIAVLGVLAAGGVYVPVGVEQPEHRRHRIYRDAGVRMVLGDGGLAVGDAVTAPPLPGPVDVPADALAYVIYTSGSTGDPKGVEITHRAAVNTVDDINRRYGIGAGDRVLAVSALDFDLSVYDIFGLLGAGGALVLPAEDERREARRWAELVRRHRVTVWNTVPALLDMLLLAADEDDLTGLRVALASGDWVGVDLPGRLAKAAPGARFVALGGATEAAIWSNAFEVSDGLTADWRSVPYGYPLSNQKFRVVDGRGRDRPNWVPGELWIGGRGVAQGYRGDPERTARQFVTVDGARWYRTGDTGCYRPGGVLEFLGRTDLQVKVRGHRIELGEVEAALAACPGVTGAVATAVGDGAERLLGAVVSGHDIDPDAVRAFASGRLTPGAVPSRVLVLPAPPLTTNGKVDRSAVARLLTRAAPETEPGPAAAGGPLVTEMAGIWAELLGVSQVGGDANFFLLGGDSIIATRLLQTVRRRYGVTLSLRRLLAAPTVDAMAAAVAAELGDEEPDFEEGLL